MPQAAIDLVLALFKDPGLVAEFRERALPGDIGQVIRIAAGEGAATEAAVEATGIAAEALAEACVFFLQQMLFAPGADSYRVLGARPDDPQDRLREHYRWLMKWLHPDRNPDGWEAVYAERVTTAWQDLKTPDRRAEYDERAPSVSLPMVTLPQANWRRPVAEHAPRGPLLSGRIVRNLPGIVLGTLAGLALVMVGATYWARSTAERHFADREASRNPPPPEVATVSAAVAPDDGMPQAAPSEPVVVAGPAQSAELSTLAWEADPRPVPDASAESLPPQLPVDADPAGGSEPVADVAADEGQPDLIGIDPAEVPAAIAAAPPVQPAPIATDAAASAPSVAAETPPSPPSLPPPAPTLAIAPMSPVAPPSSPPAPLGETTEVAQVRKVEPPAAEPAIAARPIAPMESLAPTVAPDSPARAEDGAAAVAAVEPVGKPVAADAVAATPITPRRDAPAQVSAEQLVREFVSAYAAGDRGRFDRLVSASGRDQPALADMRRRLDTTEMRFLEISQMQWRLDEDTVQASASFRDTYVPRGSRRAVTEAGKIAWEIRVEDGDHRIAGFARNAAR